MKAILDTDPWVALIDRSEAMHWKCLNDFYDKSFSVEFMADRLKVKFELKERG